MNVRPVHRLNIRPDQLTRLRDRGVGIISTELSRGLGNLVALGSEIEPGDDLHLRAFCPEDIDYTGEELRARVVETKPWPNGLTYLRVSVLENGGSNADS